MAESVNHALFRKFVDFINAPDEMVACELLSPEIALHTLVRKKTIQGSFGLHGTSRLLAREFPGRSVRA